MTRNNYPHFRKLASQVKTVIANNKGLIGDQKKQVELLYSLETKFQYYAKKHRQTTVIYKKFVEYITKDIGNILSARIYFREKNNTFNAFIAKALKASDIKALKEFHGNYHLINFIYNNWEGKLPVKVERYYNEVKEARRILIENNIPIAINRAKIFFRSTPTLHLNLLDMIGICIQGLTSGVDKYVGEYKKNWIGVAIGRMVGYLIAEQSQTFIKMTPMERKILYRANALKYRMNISHLTELTKVVNESFEDDRKEGRSHPKLPVAEIQIQTLMNGMQYVPAEVQIESEDDSSYYIPYNNMIDNNQDIEKNVAHADAMNKVKHASQKLELIEQKMIKLRGVDL